MSDHLFLQISNISIYIGFILLLISLIPLGMSISSKRSSKYANIAVWIVTIAFILELAYFIFR